MDDRYGDNRDGRWRGKGGASQHRDNYDRHGGDDRGFMERAGEEVRSWFGGDDNGAHQGSSASGEGRRIRSNQDDNNAYAGPQGTAGGWGNQSGGSWNRDRPGVSGSDGAYGASEYERSQLGGRRPERPRSGWSNESARDYRSEPARSGNWGGASNSGFEGSSGSGPGGSTHSTGDSGGGSDIWGGAGFGGGDNNVRRFDRVDPGHVGGHGAHPMSAPTGGGFATGTGISAGGGYSSSSRYYAAQREAGNESDKQHQPSVVGATRSRHEHDPHYHEWRSRQVEALDRDYDEYRREHQSKFEQDFGNWRNRRTEQRQHMGRVTEHMEVVGSDGEKIGVVDKVVGDRIILTRNEENAGGHHHSIPCSWIEKVEDKVTVNETRGEAMREWQDEEANRALFERDRQQGGGSGGPHVLNRSFSGTY